METTIFKNVSTLNRETSFGGALVVPGGVIGNSLHCSGVSSAEKEPSVSRPDFGCLEKNETNF